VQALRLDETKLGQMPTQSIDQHGALANQTICSRYNLGRHSCRGVKLFEAEEHLAKGFVRPLDLSGKFSVVLD
jgi:hypothetical protein